MSKEDGKRMKLFEVTNGYYGYSYVKMTIIAETEERALEIAKEEYKKDSPKQDGYSTNLQALVLCDDLTKEWFTEPSDE